MARRKRNKCGISLQNVVRLSAEERPATCCALVVQETIINTQNQGAMLTNAAAQFWALRSNLLWQQRSLPLWQCCCV